MLKEGIEKLVRPADHQNLTALACITSPGAGCQAEMIIETPEASPFTLLDFSSFRQTPTMTEVKNRLKSLETIVCKLVVDQGRCMVMLQSIDKKLDESIKMGEERHNK